MPTLGVVTLHDPLRLAPQDEVFASIGFQGQREGDVLQHHVHVEPQDPLRALSWNAVQRLHTTTDFNASVAVTSAQLQASETTFPPVTCSNCHTMSVDYQDFPRCNSNAVIDG